MEQIIFRMEGDDVILDGMPDGMVVFQFFGMHGFTLQKAEGAKGHGKVRFLESVKDGRITDAKLVKALKDCGMDAGRTIFLTRHDNVWYGT